MIHKMKVTITTVDWKPKCTILVPAKVDACNRLTNEGYIQCRDAALVAMEDIHAGKTPRYYANRKPKKTLMINLIWLFISGKKHTKERRIIWHTETIK